VGRGKEGAPARLAADAPSRSAVKAARVRMRVTDQATGQTVVRRRIPDEARKRRLRGTGRDYISDQGYRVVSCRGHSLADKSGRVYEHRLVLFGAIGEGPHSCHWCGRKINWKRSEGVSRLVVDHLNDERCDNRLENLVPSCVYCNSERSLRPDFLTHCGAGHPWTEENSYERPDGKGRLCRACQRAQNRKVAARRKAKAA
jgi:hypothetical protein